MKKRLQSACLAGGLLLLAVFSACGEGSQALPGIQNEKGKPVYFTSAAAGAEGVYLLAGEGKALYRLSQGEAAPRPLPLVNHSPALEEAAHAIAAGRGPAGADADLWAREAAGLDRLLSDGRRVYALNEFTGALYALAAWGEGAALSGLCLLDFSCPDPETPEAECCLGDAALAGGALYALMSWEEPGLRLYRFDLATGRREPLPAEGVIGLGPWGPEALLLVEGREEGWRIIRWETATGAEATLLEHLQVAVPGLPQGFCYDSKGDRVLFQLQYHILALDRGGEAATVAYAPLPAYAARALTPWGPLLLAQREIHLLQVGTPQPPPSPLTIAGTKSQTAQRIIESFSRAYPQIPITLEEGAHAGGALAEAFAQAMRTGDGRVDIYELPLGAALEKALARGYYVSLGSNPALAAAGERLHPFLKEEVMIQGSLAAWPAALSHQGLAYSRSALERLGLTPAELPATYQEMAEFCLSWEEKLGEQAQALDIAPFAVPAGQVRLRLLHEALDACQSLALEDSEAMLEMAAPLGQLFDSLAALKTGFAYTPAADGLNDSTMPADRYLINREPGYLFSLAGSLLPHRRQFSRQWESLSDFECLPLALEAGEKPLLPLTGSAYVVNPYSPHRAAAAAFLAYCAESAAPADQAWLYADAQPAAGETYSQLQSIYGGLLRQTEEQLALAPAYEQAELEVALAQYQAQLEQLELLKWEIPPWALADYQAALAKTRILWVEQAPNTAIVAPYSQYSTGGLTGPAFARAVLNILAMRLAEQ